MRFEGDDEMPDSWEDEEDEEHCARCGAWLDGPPARDGLCPECDQ